MKDVITKLAQKMLDGRSILHDDSARTLAPAIKPQPRIRVENSTQIDNFGRLDLSKNRFEKSFEI